MKMPKNLNLEIALTDCVGSFINVVVTGVWFEATVDVSVFSSNLGCLHMLVVFPQYLFVVWKSVQAVTFVKFIFPLKLNKKKKFK